jgi:hypothetical protein
MIILSLAPIAKFLTVTSFYIYTPTTRRRRNTEMYMTLLDAQTKVVYDEQERSMMNGG